jgi:O-antigen biosynthesis protein
MSRARICIVSPEFIGPFPNGGVGTACYWEAHTLGVAGHDVTVLYTGRTERETPAHWEAHFAATAPFRYVDLGRWAEDHAVVHPPRDGYACLESETADGVLAWLRTRQFDLVLFQEFLGHGARALQARHAAAAFDDVRMATTLHSSRQWVFEGMKRLPTSPADAAVDFLEKASARLADAAIFPSQHMADWAASRWRLSQPGAVIPYCFDTTLAQAPTAIEHSGPFRHLVFFGRLETRKGLHLFCQALAAPALRGQVDRVTFLGKPSSVEGQPSDTYIAAHMATLPEIAWTIIGDAGSFEAQTWLAAQPHVLVVAPSLVDNLPYAVIELYTRRIPFVSTAIGGIPEIVGAANRHLLAEPTATALATTVGRICREGRVAIDYRSGYDVQTANTAHVNFVRDLLARPAAGGQGPRRATRRRRTRGALDARRGLAGRGREHPRDRARWTRPAEARWTGTSAGGRRPAGRLDRHVVFRARDADGGGRMCDTARRQSRNRLA